MKGQKNGMEWSVFAVSLLLIIATIVYLVRDSLSGRSEAPQINVITGSPVQSAGLWSIPLKVTNSGDETAEELRVVVALQDGDRNVELAEVTFAFVPRRSSRDAWVLFRTDPRPLKISARAMSYERP